MLNDLPFKNEKRMVIMMKFSKREYLFIGVIVLLLFVTAGLSTFSVFFNGEQETEEWNFEEQNEPLAMEETIKEEEKESNIIVVDVKGAVKNPGVYQMEEGDRVVDAIEKAGGVLDEADVNQINFAAILQDEMVVFVPMIGEELEATNYSGTLQAQGDSQGKIRINYATSEELQQIPGIGPAKAEAIIAYREEHGPFQKEEDLLQVSGIGQKSFEKMKEYITVK